MPGRYVHTSCQAHRHKTKSSSTFESMPLRLTSISHPTKKCCPLPKGLLNRQGGMRDPGGGHVHMYVYHVKDNRDKENG